jgi:hypothetical protein
VKVATVDANDRVKLVKVALGTDFGTRVAVSAGLTGHERVIVNPQDSIVDGTPVRVVEPHAQGEAQPKGGAAQNDSGSGS